MARQISVDIVGDSASLERAFKRSERAASEFNTAMGRAGEKGRGLFSDLARTALATAGFGGAVEGIKHLIEANNDLNDQIGKNRELFGSSADAIVKWSTSTANSLGLSQRAALQATGAFGEILVPMGIAPAKAAAMSQSLTQLAADMASFSNRTPQEALDALQKGLEGSGRGLKDFGVQLTTANIKQEAVKLGFKQSAESAAQLKAAYTSAAEAYKTAHTQQTDAARELTKAQTELTSSQQAAQSAADGVTAAQDRLTTATQNVTTAEDREQSASDSLTAAKQALTDAQNTTRQSQEALTQARKDAVAQLQSLRDATINSQLSEERASLSLDQARARLAKVNADSTATELDRRDAALSVIEAEQSLHEAHEKRISDANANREAEKKGVQGSKDVVDAHNAIYKAQEAQQAATVRVEQAQRALTQAQVGVSNALIAAAKAQQGLADAQAKAADANARYQAAQVNLTRAQDASAAANARAKTAEDQLAAAKEKSAEASKRGADGLTDQQRALSAYNVILQQTSIQHGNFARNADNLTNSQRRLGAMLDDLSTKLGAQLTPFITQAANAMIRWLSNTQNQKTILDGFKLTLDIVKGAVDFLRGAFHLLSEIVGGNKQAIEFLILAYAGWKIGKLVLAIGELATSFVSLGTVETEAAVATEGLSIALGPAVLVAGALAAGAAIGTLLLQIGPVRDAINGLTDDIANLLGYKNPLDQFRNTTVTQTNIAQARQAAAQLEASGLSPSQAAARLAPQFPVLAPHDLGVAAGVYGQPPTVNFHGPVTFSGVQDVPGLYDKLVKAGSLRPQPRRG